MKTVLEYLNERKDMAWHNRLCCAKNLLMLVPKDGYEKEFENSVRDCEIVDQLISMVTRAVDPALLPQYLIGSEEKEPDQEAVDLKKSLIRMVSETSNIVIKIDN